MKTSTTLIFFFLLFSALKSQTSIDSLLNISQEYENSSEYEKATDIYLEALEIEPNSSIINYKLATNFYYQKKYKKAIKHFDKVIENNNDYTLEAYISKGICLDENDDTDDAIEVFEEAISKFGNNYQLYYNLGMSYYKEKEYEKAEEALIKSITIKPKFASSHLVLGLLMKDMKKRGQCILCLQYFLCLEPNSERSKTALQVLLEQYRESVKTYAGKGYTFTIASDFFTKKDSTTNELSNALTNIMFAHDEFHKSDEELFLSISISFFTDIVEKYEEKKKKSELNEIWWNFYIPFFSKIIKSDYAETYCYSVMVSLSEKAVEWIQKNIFTYEEYINWVNKEL